MIPFFLIKRNEGILPITDERMTRFNITLNQGVDFVLKCIDKMWGGEIFIPKIPSYRILDVAKAIAPKAKVNIIGIRSGEKISEVLCPSESSYLTVEFNDHFIILPSINFSDDNKNLMINRLNEKGKKVAEGFEYNSANNPHFLKVEEIKNYL